MTGDSNKSFDPRTWGQSGKADAATPAASETGFDPRTWVGPLDPDDLPSAPAHSGGGPQGRGLGRTVAFGAATAMLLAVAAGGYWLWQPAAPPTEKIAVKTAAKPAPVRKRTGEARIVQVAGIGGVMRALLDMGIPTEEAFQLSRDTAAALTGTEDAIRLEVELRPSRGTEPIGVTRLAASLSSGQGVTFTRKADGTFERADMFAQASTTIRRVEGRMGKETFYVDAVNAGMPDSLITPFAKAFSFDFDFQRDVAIGDRFEAVWEESLAADGRTAAPAKLLYAALETAKGPREYYAFTPPDELEERWFDQRGQGAQRGLMRTPVDGARISSRFGNRIHPIYKYQKLHGGVDFAAPSGTPVYASGDAKVVFRAFAGGAGNLIKLQHETEDDMLTKYLHLSRFAEGLEVGQRVRQGQIIGYVGTTGNSTGPHLHYEIHLAGVKVDPLTYETTQVAPLTGEALRMFAQRRAEIDQLREKRR